MFGVIDRGSTLQGIATIPEFIWELSFGIYLIVKGFKPSPLLTRERGEPTTRVAVAHPDAAHVTQR
jgi:hypothetical protein